MKYGGGLTKYQKKGEFKPFPLKPEEIEYYYKFKLPEKNKSEFNAALVPGGSPEVQKYQKMLNEKYGTFLVEEGAWGPKTQAAYEKYIVNKEQPPAFTPTHFRPTLEEFKSIYERIPSYNYGYESLYDADPKNIYVQQGPLTKERTEQIQALPSEEQLRKSYLGKTFGGLPMFHAFGIYGGYSPTRTWTGKDPYMVPDKGDISLLKSKKPLYAYILAPKPGTQPDKVLTNPVTKEDLLKDPEAVKNTYKYIAKNASTIDNYKTPKIGTDYNFLDFADKINSFTDEDWANPEKVKSITDDFLYQDTLFGDYNNLNLKIPYAEQCWGCSKTMESELLANPEIVKYTKEKGLDLANAKYAFTNEYGVKRLPSYAENQLAEAVLAKRWNDVNKTPLVMSPTGSTTVIQNPDAFNLSGYLPLTEDMFYIDSDGYPTANWDDPVKRKEYLKKAGVPEDVMDKVLIHTSPFPIQEYKPRTNAQGNIYQYGGGLPKYQRRGEISTEKSPIELPYNMQKKGGPFIDDEIDIGNFNPNPIQTLESIPFASLKPPAFAFPYRQTQENSLGYPYPDDYYDIKDPISRKELRYYKKYQRLPENLKVNPFYKTHTVEKHDGKRYWKDAEDIDYNKTLQGTRLGQLVYKSRSKNSKGVIDQFGNLHKNYSGLEMGYSPRNIWVSPTTGLGLYDDSDPANILVQMDAGDVEGNYPYIYFLNPETQNVSEADTWYNIKNEGLSYPHKEYTRGDYLKNKGNTLIDITSNLKGELLDKYKNQFGYSTDLMRLTSPETTTLAGVLPIDQNIIDYLNKTYQDYSKTDLTNLSKEEINSLKLQREADVKKFLLEKAGLDPAKYMSSLMHYNYTSPKIYADINRPGYTIYDQYNKMYEELGINPDKVIADEKIKNQETINKIKEFREKYNMQKAGGEQLPKYQLRGEVSSFDGLVKVSYPTDISVHSTKLDASGNPITVIEYYDKPLNTNPKTTTSSISAEPHLIRPFNSLYTDDKIRAIVKYGDPSKVPTIGVDVLQLRREYPDVNKYRNTESVVTKQMGGESNLFNWDNLNQWFKNGGESDFVNNIYNDYMDGIYDGTPLEENAKKVYDKLNTIYYRQAKESGMTPPNYIMTNVIKKGSGVS